MDSLTLLQIEKISQEVRREDITYSHLLHDLVDHVCCDVEYEMEHGLTFAEAYARVKEKIGTHGLRKIQADTLYVVDSKYRFMKNTMKIAGISGTILLGFAALFKIMHWPGAGIMITLGAFILAFVFLPSSLSVLYKESKSGKQMLLFVTAFLAAFFFIVGVLFKIQHWPMAGIMVCVAVVFSAFFLPQLLAKKMKETTSPQKRPVYVLGFIAAYIYLFGMLFKFMHWPFAGILIFVGAILLFGMAFPWYAWLTWKDAPYVYATFIFIVPTVIWVLVSSGLINLRLSYNYLEGFSREYERQDALYTYLMAENSKRLTDAGDTSLRARMNILHEKSQKIVSQVQHIKARLAEISSAGSGARGISEQGLILQAVQYSDYVPADAGLLSGSSPERRNLEENMAAYNRYVSQEYAFEPALVARINQLVQPSVYIPDTANLHFIFMGSCLNKLTMLQNAVLLSESQLVLALNKPAIATLKNEKK